MSKQSSSKKSSSKSSSKVARKSGFRPSLELLEIRELLTTFVVASNGNDSNNGSANTPWATLQHAADMANAGDTVIIHAGTYKGWVQSKSGTTNNYIRFLADSGTIINQAGNLSSPAFVADQG